GGGWGGDSSTNNGNTNSTNNNTTSVSFSKSSKTPTNNNNTNNTSLSVDFNCMIPGVSGFQYVVLTLYQKGGVEFELQPLTGLTAECGSVLGPDTDELVRLVGLLPRFPGLHLPRRSRERQKLGQASAELPLRRVWVALGEGNALKLRINVEHFTVLVQVRDK
ncbi:hypothetical protein B484DRAFT_439916, partial [Ochromonadaceae sp. CCMP2298]